MSYTIRISRSAERDLRKLSRPVQVRIFASLEDLRDDPRPRGVVKMKGQHEGYRLRVGQYRIVYEVQDDVLLIVVVRVRDRRDVYR